MKYKFENFSAELVNPTIETVTPSYSIGSETVKVQATLNANENKLFGVYLGDMPNTEEWTDKDVMNFALAELEKFRVK
jgi:hypothetical protein